MSDETSLVVLLIDEVESLAGARQAALSGSEPSDSIRVVNALLTQLDQLKHKRNVLICCTSNLSQAIGLLLTSVLCWILTYRADLAFLDRADMRLFIGPPGANARLEILRSCLAELIRTGIVKEDAERSGSVPDDGDALKQLALDLEGISGRSLRRLPFQAQSLYVNVCEKQLKLCWFWLTGKRRSLGQPHLNSFRQCLVHIGSFVPMLKCEHRFYHVLCLMPCCRIKKKHQLPCALSIE